MIEAKSMNVSEGFLGKRGSGKSTRALARCIELAQEYHAYVLAHDRRGTIPDAWPDGKPTGVVRHENIEAAASAIREGRSGLHAIATKNPQDVVNLGIRIADASFKAGSAATGRSIGHPVIVYIDEIVEATGASPYRLSDEMRDLIAVQRHLNVGMVWTTQSPRFVHYQLLALATKLWLFKITDERALDNLGQAGVPPSTLVKLPALDVGQHIIFSDL